MSDTNKFSALVDDIWEMVFGTPRRPEVKFKGMMTKEKPKRARTKNGKYKADDKRTKEFNEAWVGGKAPKKKTTKSKGRKTLGTKNKTKQTKK